MATPHRSIISHHPQLAGRSFSSLLALLSLPVLSIASGCSGDAGPGGSTGGAANSNTGGSLTSTGGGEGTGTGGTSTGTGGSSSGGVHSDGGSPSGGSGSGGEPDGATGGAASGGAESGTGGGDGRSSGCGTPFQSPPPKNEQQTLQIEGDERYYLLDVPDGADNTEPLMLIFGLHGYDMNNIAVVDLFNFTERSQGRAITVWPQGEGPHPGNVEHWGDQVLKSTWTPNEKNYAFFRQMIDTIGERYCIDETRIFISGFSMGGFFTNQMACDNADWFRAFAPVAGGGPQACANPSVQSAIMVQHGTADDIVELSSGEGSRDFWLEQNGCASSTSSSLNNCQFYDDCAADKPVAWCTGNYDHYIPNEVASNIWSFFSSF